METVAGRRGRTRSRQDARPVRALDRGLLLLEVLSEARELPLSAVARRLHLPFSTTFRLLETLRRRGFVSQSSETGLYRLGIRAFEVGSTVLTQGQLHEVAHPVMNALVDELNETVNLAVRDKTEAVYMVESRLLVRKFTQVGARTPLYCTGVGKVLLAWRPPEEALALLTEGPLVPLTKNEERELGVRCVAAPVRDGKGGVIAALSLSAPASRLPRRMGAIAERVMVAAGQISAGLGWKA